MCADGSRARSEMTKTATASKKFGGDVMKGFKQLAGAATIAAAAYLALRKMTEFIKGSFKAYMEYEDQLSMLNATLVSTGYAAGLSKTELVKMASELQRFTTVSNTAALEAEGIMLTFTKIGKEVFPEALEAATNMSVRFGQDLKQSMVQLGTALNDPIMGVGRLRRIGISFTEQQKDQIKVLMESNDILGAQTVILKELETELGGVARAMRNTFKGEMTAFKNNMSDLKRILGGLMSEDSGLKGFVKKMNEFLEQENNMRNIVRVFQSFGLVAITAFRVIVFYLKYVINFWKGLYYAIRDVGNAIKIVFDPRNWKMGAMKKAFEDFHWTVADVARDIAADAVKLAQDTRDSFMKILSPEMPKPDVEPLKGAMQEIVIEAEKVDEVIYHGYGNLIMYNKHMMEAADSALFFAANVKALTDAEVDHNLIMETTNKLADDYTHLLQEQEKALKAHEDLVGNITDGMIGMADSIKEGGNVLEDMARHGLKMVIRALGEYLMALAATAIFYDPIKAIAAFIGGTAAIAFSNTLQQGGMIPGGYGGGDSQPTMTEPGEMVVTKENVRRNRALLTRMETGTAEMPITIYLGTKRIYSEITKAINETREIKIRAR